MLVVIITKLYHHTVRLEGSKYLPMTKQERAFLLDPESSCRVEATNSHKWDCLEMVRKNLPRTAKEVTFFGDEAKFIAANWEYVIY